MRVGVVLMIVVVLIIFIAVFLMSTASPGAGQEAVLIKKPWIFGHGGVDPDSVKTGLAFIAPSTQVVYVTMQPKSYIEDLPDMMTADGVPIAFHATAVLQPTQSVPLIQNFGENWYQNNVQQEFQSQIRDQVRQHGMNETAISTTALSSIQKNLQAGMAQYLADKQIPVRLVTMIVGKANPPDSVKTMRIATAAQEQRIQTEQQTKLAEDQRQLAENSRAKADNAYREAMSLSPEQFIQLQRINMERDVCGEHGGGHCTFIQGQTQPLVQVK